MISRYSGKYDELTNLFRIAFYELVTFLYTTPHCFNEFYLQNFKIYNQFLIIHSRNLTNYLMHS